LPKIKKSKKARYKDPTPYSQRDYTPDEEWNVFLQDAEDVVHPEEAAARKKKIYDDLEKSVIDAMSTPEGKQSLAEAMVFPIGRSLDYSGIGRKILMVDELPQGAYASYEKA
jgi:hypothetical protein